MRAEQTETELEQPAGLAQEVIGCFREAEIEGLSAALANTTDFILKDLVERRLMRALYAAQAAAPAQNPVALPCCGYTDASAVKWNPSNGVVQCHNCGQTYTAPPAGKGEP